VQSLVWPRVGAAGSTRGGSGCIPRGSWQGLCWGSGSVWGWVVACTERGSTASLREGSEQADPVEDVRAHCRGGGLDGLKGPFPPKASCGSMILQFVCMGCGKSFGHHRCQHSWAGIGGPLALLCGQCTSPSPAWTSEGAFACTPPCRATSASTPRSIRTSAPSVGGSSKLG